MDIGILLALQDFRSRRDSPVLFCADTVCVFYLSVVPEVS